VDQIFGVSKEKINPNAVGSGGNGTITNKIDGFKERIEAMLPTLIEHRCSEGCQRDFFQSGTRYLDGAIEHIALEIQTLAGMDTGFGRTRDQNTWDLQCCIQLYRRERWPFGRISRCDWILIGN
jgi:hypothetical protein